MHDSLCPFSIFSSGGHLVKPKGTILAILVKGHKRKISSKWQIAASYLLLLSARGSAVRGPTSLYLHIRIPQFQCKHKKNNNMNSKYVDLKLADLKAELKKRHTKVTGRKKELVERLFSSNL